MASAARRWPNHPGGDEVGKAIVWCVEWTEFGDGATPVGDDHFFTGFYAIDVFAQTILEIADSDL